MRLWHYKTLHYLPRQQLLSQWRELNNVYSNSTKHILINYIYEYDKVNLYSYSNMVIDEIKSRGYKIKSFDLYNIYFKNEIEIFKDEDYVIFNFPFIKHMNDEYLKICCWNLYEKYLRGQTGFSLESTQFILKTIGEIQ